MKLHNIIFMLTLVMSPVSAIVAEAANPNPAQPSDVSNQYEDLIQILIEVVNEHQAKQQTSTPLVPNAKGLGNRLNRFFSRASDTLEGQPGRTENMIAQQALRQEQLRRSQQALDPQTQYVLQLLHSLLLNEQQKELQNLRLQVIQMRKQIRHYQQQEKKKR